MTLDDALISLMSRHGFVLPRNAIEWRVSLDKEGKSPRGSLPSVSLHSATLLCTDGMVAYFLLGDGETLFFGHLSAFVPNKPERPAKRDEKGRSRSPRKSSVDSALALLADFVAKHE